jgi:FtsP/CotA-like multicopper oxidase with cupredoxin domain
MIAAGCTAARLLRAFAVAVALAVPTADGAPARAADKPSTTRSEQVFDLRIEGGKLAKEKRVIRVKQGDVVRLRWTADAPIVLHLHGYDIERRVGPGSVAEMAFTANATGRFSISVHGKADASKGGHHHDPLARLEVHPR